MKFTYILKINKHLLTWLGSAIDEWITSIAIRTATERVMSDYFTFSRWSTSSCTRLYTETVDTSFAERTVRVGGTPRLATRLRRP